MKIKKLLIILIITTGLILSFIPFSAADEELAEFDLGPPNRIRERSWQDVESSDFNSGENGSSWNGLTFEIFKASKTLFIEVENEPADEFNIVIIGNHETNFNEAWETGTVTYKKADVFEDGFITIDLHSNPGWQKVIASERPGFRIVLEGRGWNDVGDIFGLLEYEKSQIDTFNLWKFNMVFHDTQNQKGFSDQERAEWEEENKIGLTADIFARATSLKFAVANAPIGDITVSFMNNATNWEFTANEVSYSTEDVYADNIITIPLAGPDAPQFMTDFRERPEPRFTIGFKYSGSNTVPQTVEDLGIENMWLEFTEIESEPEPGVDPEPDPDYGIDPEPDPEPGIEPVIPPTQVTPANPVLMLSDDISPWAVIFLVIVAVIAVGVVILTAVMKKKSSR